MVVRINACVNDRNPGACAGVSGGPSPGEPIISEEVDIFGSAVPVDTTSGRYCVSNTTFSTPGRASILEICPYSTLTDRIFAARCQVPDDVRGFSSGRLHAGGHILLQLPQTPAVGRRLEIFCKMFGGKASCQGGGLLQHHGYPDQVRIQVVR